MDEKLKQMEQFVKGGKFNKEKLKSIPIDKDQLIKCFELYIKSKQNINREQDIQTITPNENETKEPLEIGKLINENQGKESTLNNKKPHCSIDEQKRICTEVSNVDDIPIIQKNVDFNSLVEEQLAKGQYAINKNFPKKKLNYENKPKYIDKYKLSEPGETKKYKYYSDNFKRKETSDNNSYNVFLKQVPCEINKAEVKSKLQLDNNNAENILDLTLNKKEKHKGTNQTQINKNNKQGIIILCDNQLNKDNKGSVEVEEEEDYYLGFNASNTVKGVIRNNIIHDKTNFNNKNELNEIDQNINLKFSLEEKEIDNSEDEILKKILNHKNNTLKPTNTAERSQTPIFRSNTSNNNIRAVSAKDKQNNNIRCDNKKDNSQDEQNLIDESGQNDYTDESQIDQLEEEEDDEAYEGDIYQLFSNNNDKDFHLNNNSCFSPSENNESKRKIIPKPSKIMSKYFKDIINEKEPNWKQQQQKVLPSKGQFKPKTKMKAKTKDKPKSILKTKAIINELVKEKLEELSQAKERLDKENKISNGLKREYDHYIIKLRTETDEHQKNKESNQIAFEQSKAEEIKRIENERKVKLQNTNLLHNLPNKGEREKIDLLKETIMKLQEEMKQKDQKNKLAIERMKKQLEEIQKKKEELMNEIKFYDERKNKTNNCLDNDNPSNNQIQSNKAIKDTSDLEKDQDLYYRDYQSMDKTLSEVIDIELLSQYHDPKGNNHQPSLIQEDMTSDGKIIRIYNTKKEIIFSSGMKKEIFNDGYQFTLFPNKDIKQLYPNGKEVYLFSNKDIIQIKWPDGVQGFKFGNGNIEQIFPDGTKMIKYPNGSKVSINNHLINSPYSL